MPLWVWIALGGGLLVVAGLLLLILAQRRSYDDDDVEERAPASRQPRVAAAAARTPRQKTPAAPPPVARRGPAVIKSTAPQAPVTSAPPELAATAPQSAASAAPPVAKAAHRSTGTAPPRRQAPPRELTQPIEQFELGGEDDEEETLSLDAPDSKTMMPLAPVRQVSVPPPIPVDALQTVVWPPPSLRASSPKGEAEYLAAFHSRWASEGPTIALRDERIARIRVRIQEERELSQQRQSRLVRDMNERARTGAHQVGRGDSKLQTKLKTEEDRLRRLERMVALVERRRTELISLRDARYGAWRRSCVAATGELARQPESGAGGTKPLADALRALGGVAKLIIESGGDSGELHLDADPLRAYQQEIAQLGEGVHLALTNLRTADTLRDVARSRAERHEANQEALIAEADGRGIVASALEAECHLLEQLLEEQIGLQDILPLEPVDRDAGLELLRGCEWLWVQQRIRVLLLFDRDASVFEESDRLAFAEDRQHIAETISAWKPFPKATRASA